MTLNRILAFDALTCALMGSVLILSAPALSALMVLPQDLLFIAGCVLLPIALFMAVLARQVRPWTAGVWLVILGNAAWVAGSLALVAVTGPNLLGTGFLILQALVVALLGLAEFNAGPRRPAGFA
ncbi:hypothetical protein [Devosia nitrariae]|uniref:SPW repeat-containing protein n=1 Tax=Devosia nitrariae TaxID=2071872 RepID=A0ABQ5W732_9HYPH|nr:hypothetical protein [Devosia nitrariae]GLQ55877.1 hypothetical protein GCM10010862_31360 [Devosia nitrariae]